VKNRLIKTKNWCFILLIALLVVVPFVIKSDYIIHFLILTLWLGTLAASLDLSTGYTGLVNFGYAGFIGAGAYVAALVVIYFNISPWIGILVGGIASASLGLVIGLITLRLYGFYFAIFTLFTSEALRFAIANLPEWTRGYLGLMVPPLTGLDPSLRIPYYYVMLGISLIILFILSLAVKSKIGLALKAIREDEVKASTMGVNTVLFKVLSVTISCFFAGVLGAFYSYYIGILTPDVLAISLTIEVLTINYVGGRGTLWGSIVAAFILQSILEILRPLVIVRLIMYGILLIVVILFLPKGLAPYFQKFSVPVRK